MRIRMEIYYKNQHTNINLIKRTKEKYSIYKIMENQHTHLCTHAKQPKMKLLYFMMKC